MTPEQVLDIIRTSVWVMIKVSSPLLGVALAVGLTISLVQALTQLQEMTLSFVPKILSMLLVMVLTAPFGYGVLRAFTEDLFARIALFGAG
jgi:flagellar biosynthetic protein FliQ